MDEIERDLNLLVKNAHAFNEPGSQVYKVWSFPVAVHMTIKLILWLQHWFTRVPITSIYFNGPIAS